ncbi:MAG: ATP-binding protein [Clostridia bacterium]|nr:ATP-binding protein [Clostridia bacterium]
MSKINDIYSSLCVFSVTRGILKAPIFKSFFEYCEEENKKEKIKKYGAFVAEIYKNGGNISKCVQNALFENENVYVKSVAWGQEINKNIENALNFELSVLNDFASLSANSFAIDMGIGTKIPEFDSDKADISKLYKQRLASIEKYGYGIFASNCMFASTDSGEIVPIESADETAIDTFIGYQEERQKVLDNTIAFLENRPAANILLYGDAGTGKSSTVKAVANHLFENGIRLIEVRKNQLLLLPKIMAQISKNPLKFIIFIDDLSFNKNDDNFSMLKATLEGSASAKAKNAVIYATSNRRHIVKETFGDREGDDVHRNDTVQETLSLSERFGLTILFAKPSKPLYLEIVKELAKRNNVKMDEAELQIKAEAFALSRGYRSARCAEQFIDSLM